MIRRQLSSYLGICEGNRGTLHVATALECARPQRRVTGHLQLLCLARRSPRAGEGGPASESRL